jgi:rRNA maturation protein Nop10
MKHETEFCQTIALLNLYTLRDSIRVSLEDIKTNNPHRVDLIEPMQKHLDNLKNAIFVFQELERTIIKLRRSNRIKINPVAIFSSINQLQKLIYAHSFTR